jgi:hypothetical protein
MKESKLDILIKDLVDYIMEHATKDPMPGKERDNCLNLAQEISDKIATEVLIKFHERQKE